MHSLCTDFTDLGILFIHHDLHSKIAFWSHFILFALVTPQQVWNERFLLRRTERLGAPHLQQRAKNHHIETVI